MQFYNYNNEKLEFNTRNRFDGGNFGDIYRISDGECLKIIKTKVLDVDAEVLRLIQKLSLKNFYEIYELLYNANGLLRAYSMKYYQSEEIDILTMPIDYTLDNLFRLYDSVEEISINNILMNDTREGNVIMNKNDITVIDVDMYRFNSRYTLEGVRSENIKVLRELFQEIYIEALINYHEDYRNKRTIQLIKEVFNLYGRQSLESTSKKLMRYKCPIDYIRANRY